MSKLTKSQLKYLQLYFTFGIVILLLPVIAYGANLAREKYIASKKQATSQISSLSSIPIQTKLVLAKVNSVFGLEMEVPSNSWRATIESKTGSIEQANRQLSLRIGDTSNSIYITIMEHLKETKDKGYLNPNGDVPANFFGMPTTFRKAFDNKTDFTLVIDRANPASNIMTDNDSKKVESFKIARLENEFNRGYQVLYNLLSKRDGGRDLTKENSIAYPMYDTKFQLFPDYAFKYPDRFLYLKIDYSTPFNYNYGDYDKVVQSLKLLEF